MPTPNPAGTPGWFAHGNPATGVPYTTLTSDWANAVQAELLNVLAAAGITPNKTQTNQLLLAIQSTQRIKVTPISYPSGLTMYVNGGTGNDSNTGLTSSSPFKTLQRAADIITYNYDVQGTIPTVIVTDGTYTAGVTLNGQFLHGAIHFVGNVTTPRNCTVALPSGGVCFNAVNGAIMYVSGFAMTAPNGSTGALWTAAGVALQAVTNGVIVIDHVAFGPCSFSHMQVSNNGQIAVNVQATPYTIYGSTLYHLLGSNAGSINLPSVLATVTANVTFSYFANFDGASMLYAPSATFSNGGFTVTNSSNKYIASNAGYIITNGGGAGYFPGTGTGVTTTGYYN